MLNVDTCLRIEGSKEVIVCDKFTTAAGIQNRWLTVYKPQANKLIPSANMLLFDSQESA